MATSSPKEPQTSSSAVSPAVCHGDSDSTVEFDGTDLRNVGYNIAGLLYA
jgi:hypothetical protein